jgi:predicted ATP-dependent protease
VPVPPLPPEALRRRCDPATLPFASTAELEPLAEAFGQERAVEALRFGASMRRDGYHVFALGPAGAGKRRLVWRLLAERAAAEPVPPDWCYLHDFEDSQHPRAVDLPPGTGQRFRRDMDALVEELKAAVPAAFESDEYRTRLQMMHKQLEEEREKAMAALSQKAEARSIGIVRTPVGLAVAPVKEGEVLEPERFRQLPAEERERIQKDLQELQEALAEVMRTFPAQERRHREQVKEMNREVAQHAVGHLIDDVRARYGALPQVVAHLDAVRKDVVENVHEFLGAAADGGEEGLPAQMRRLFTETPAMRRYQVNVLVDRSGATGAPLVEEDLPTHAALVGRMEHQAHFGALVTDFTLLRGGALHRANGGYLLLDARRLLTQPFAWEELKRALRSRLLRIEPAERRFGLGGATALEPRPIPLDLKVVLLGDRMLYYLLAELDPEFPALFKVAADFEDEVARDGGELPFAQLLARLIREEGLRPLDRGGVARLLEEAARLAGDAGKLTARIDDLADLLREADLSAAAAGRAQAGAADVQAAVDGQERRADRIPRLTLERIAEGTLLIDTAGAQVGQVNGLSVLSLGRRSFGRPTRITARVRLGRGEVVDIEREVELGGPIHSKGVLILAGFLGARFAADRPFSLAATLVFEQSYGGVEGDSASSAELYALLSALSGLPLRQSLAVTGSVNQLGRVQAIGGVNEKIEGFFEVCKGRGLSGEQGVLIPASNARHLMLHEEVVEAVRQGRFRVWPVETVDQGIELLTGVAAGERGPDGRWPEGSVNALVAARLEALSEAARAFGAGPRDGREGGR